MSYSWKRDGSDDGQCNAMGQFETVNVLHTKTDRQMLQASSFEKTFTGVMCCVVVDDDADHGMMMARMMMLSKSNDDRDDGVGHDNDDDDDDYDNVGHDNDDDDDDFCCMAAGPLT